MSQGCFCTWRCSYMEEQGCWVLLHNAWKAYFLYCLEALMHLCIRALFSPFYFCWQLFVPSYYGATNYFFVSCFRGNSFRGSAFKAYAFNKLYLKILALFVTPKLFVLTRIVAQCSESPKHPSMFGNVITTPQFFRPHQLTLMGFLLFWRIYFSKLFFCDLCCPSNSCIRFILLGPVTDMKACTGVENHAA